MQSGYDVLTAERCVDSTVHARGVLNSCATCMTARGCSQASSRATPLFFSSIYMERRGLETQDSVSTTCQTERLERQIPGTQSTALTPRLGRCNLIPCSPIEFTPPQQTTTLTQRACQVPYVIRATAANVEHSYIRRRRQRR